MFEAIITYYTRMQSDAELARDNEVALYALEMQYRYCLLSD